jgi:hypothetical protein
MNRIQENEEGFTYHEHMMLRMSLEGDLDGMTYQPAEVLLTRLPCRGGFSYNKELQVCV